MKALITGAALLVATAATAQPAVGQELPPLSVKTFRNNKDGSTNLAIRKGRPLLVVFWSKDCSNSHEFIWSLNGMMKEVGDVEALLVAMAPEAAIQDVLEKKPRLAAIRLPFAGMDSALFRLFPHQVTPHVAWIGADGRLKAITAGSLVSTENLRKLKEKKELQLPWKQENMNDSLYRIKYPLVTAGLQQKKTFTSSCLTGELKGVAGGGGLEVNEQDNTLRLRLINVSVPWLYRFAFLKLHFFHQSRVVVEGGGPGELSDTRLCYELLTSDTTRAKALRFLQQDLDRSLGFTSRQEVRKIKVLVLRRTSSLEKFRGENGKPVDSYLENGKYRLKNVPITAVVNNLFNSASLFPYPVINETGYSGRVNIEICDRFKDLDCVNRSLEKYDLRLDEEWRDMEVIVLRKNGEGEEKTPH